MTAQDLAALHARCFTHPPPWSAASFAALLDSPHVFLLQRTDGFLIGRAIAGEAELLTLAVAPDARRQGLGGALLQDFVAEAKRRGARDAFLEVASDNQAARALYAGQGWRQAGRRPDYYAPGIDALTLRLAL